MTRNSLPSNQLDGLSGQIPMSESLLPKEVEMALMRVKNGIGCFCTNQ